MLLFGIELYALIAADGNPRRLLPGAERPATTESSLAGRVVTLPWLQLRNIEHIITRYYLKPQSPFGQRALTSDWFAFLSAFQVAF